MRISIDDGKYFNNPNISSRGGLEAEIVETTFVISRFSDIRKETTLFLVLPKRNDPRLVS